MSQAVKGFSNNRNDLLLLLGVNDEFYQFSNEQYITMVSELEYLVAWSRILMKGHKIVDINILKSEEKN